MGASTRDLLNPLRAEGIGNHGKMRAFQRLPSVGPTFCPTRCPTLLEENSNANGNRLTPLLPPAATGHMLTGVRRTVDDIGDPTTGSTPGRSSRTAHGLPERTARGSDCLFLLRGS